MTLTKKHQQFVVEYLKDKNAAKAAIRCGYSARSARSQGSRLLTKADIQAALEDILGEARDQAVVDKAWVLSNSKEITERCMQHVPVMVQVGSRRVPLRDAHGNAIYAFDAGGAARGIEIVAKTMGYYTEKHQISGTDGGPLTICWEGE